MSNILSNVGQSTTRFIFRTGLKIKKVSPEILVAAGVVGVVATVVVACKKTIEAKDIIEEFDEERTRIESVKLTVSNDEEKKDYKKELFNLYFTETKKLAKHYAPAVGLGVVSLACIIGSHNILRKRNIAMAAAYKALDESYKKYRQRVIDEFSEEVDKRFKNGIYNKEIEVTNKDENGEEKKEVSREDVVNSYEISDYAKFFDEGCAAWTKDPNSNLLFLKQIQTYCTEKLKSRGYLFLNEVYDELGIPRTPAGQVVGWLYNKETGDNYVDFDIYNIHRTANRDFVNGYERSILLDFNVDGVIWDKI